VGREDPDAAVSRSGVDCPPPRVEKEGGVRNRFRSNSMQRVWKASTAYWSGKIGAKYMQYLYF
jgi:hypothetical protein